MDREIGWGDKRAVRLTIEYRRTNGRLNIHGPMEDGRDRYGRRYWTGGRMSSNGAEGGDLEDL